MHDSYQLDDLDELLSVAANLSDRLEVVAHSHQLRLAAMAIGACGLLGCLIGVVYLSFSTIRDFRFSEELYSFGPLILLFMFYLAAVLISAMYRLLIDRMYLRLVRKRLTIAIDQAHQVQLAE